MAVEFELKFRATPEKLDALDKQISGACQEFAMETTYYDTPDKALSSRRLTLRRRMENGISVCTLKTPAEDGGRGEYEVRCGDIETAIPELCKLAGLPEVLSLTRKGVAPVCAARFTRRAKLITLPDCTVELALDLGTLSGGGKEVPLCEAEVELKAGSREGAIAYARAVAALFGLQQETKSKFRRALELAEGEK